MKTEFQADELIHMHTMMNVLVMIISAIILQERLNYLCIFLLFVLIRLIFQHFIIHSCNSFPFSNILFCFICFVVSDWKINLQYFLL